jgi:anti-anti-sigma factor
MRQSDTATPPPNRLEIISATDEVAVVALIGEHDMGRYEPLKAALARAAIRAPNVVVDLTQCAFIDSTTLTLLLHADDVMTRDSRGFAVVIPAHEGSVSRLAELVRLAEMLSTHPSLEAAMASFKSRPLDASS